MLGALRNAARQTSRATSAARFSTSNFKVAQNYPEYINTVKGQDEDKLVVAFFNAKSSTWGKIIAPQFAEIAKSYPQHQFISVDVDAVPRAAYHADVIDPTAIVVMNREDAFRAVIGPEEHADFSTIVTRAKAAIDSFKYDANVTGQSSWDHNIRRDNLNAVDQGLVNLPKDN